MQIIGTFLSMSQRIASSTHAFRQIWQPVHFFSITTTPPPDRSFNAPSGQALAHGGSRQAAQTRIENFPSSPVLILTRIADLSRDSSLYRVRAHAYMHKKQPMQRSRYKTFNRLPFLGTISVVAGSRFAD